MILRTLTANVGFTPTSVASGAAAVVDAVAVLEGAPGPAELTADTRKS